jgi:hypothetical protein
MAGVTLVNPELVRRTKPRNRWERRPAPLGEFGKKAFAFVEYVGDYHEHGGPSYLINSGAGYRITDTQQIDFHLAVGLNDNAPHYFFGIGYSFRFDRLF